MIRPGETPLAPVRTIADIEAFESVPLERRLEGLNSSYDVLVRAAARCSDAPALVFVPDGDPAAVATSMSYGELLARVTRTANLFHALGVGPRDVVAYAMPNLLETHVTLWAAETAGVACAINPSLEASQIAHILDAAEAKVLVTMGPTHGAELWRKVSAIRRDVPSLETILVAGEDDDLGPDVLSFDRALARQPFEVLETGRVIRREDVASLIHTGGTTGAPKIAQHTHVNELTNALRVASACGLGPGDTLLSGLPLFHVNGVIVTGLAPFMAGARVVLLGANGYRSKTALSGFWRMVERYQATFFSAVPTVFAALLAIPQEGALLSSLRYALCGAAPMPTELIRRFEEASGVRILEGYGLTEGTCVSAVNPRDGERRVGSVGLRLPYQQLKTVELDGNGRWLRDCELDEIGTLVIRGPNVFPGYKQSEANERLWVADGWLDTGDLARIDAEQYVWLTGRQKDLIIRGGHNLDPRMIEQAMMSHPAVLMAAAVGKPDAYAGELPVVFVQLRDGAHATPEALLAHARAAVPERAAVPVDIFVRNALPITAVGKIYKPELRKEVTQITFSALLRALAGDEARFCVTVAPDPRHGTAVKVVGETRLPVDDGLDRRVRGLLTSFGGHYSLEWVQS